MMRCMIIDDEPLAAKLIAAYIEKMDELEMTAMFHNPLKALSYLQENEVDLIFLDIQMPELSGIQFAKIISDKTKIIFTTAYPDYAIEGFELNAVDYLMKPINLERFIKSVNRIKEQFQETKQQKTTNSESTSDYIFVKTEYRHQKIKFEDILYFKGYGDYVAIYKLDEKILTLQNLKHFEQVLPSQKFMRIHKSYIIALDKIDFIEKNRVVIDKEYIPVSNSYQQELKEKLGLK